MTDQSVFCRRYDERQIGDTIVMFTDQMLPATLPAGWTGLNDLSINMAYRIETGDWLGADNHRRIWRDAMHPSAKVWFAAFGNSELSPWPEDEPEDEQSADVRDTDRNGVEFGSNCVTPDTCRLQNLCLGTCKLF